MSQVDSRSSSSTKRARTDGGRREDDWTCPSCDNVNFSFRTTCNKRKCSQPRPADHNTKSAPKPMQSQQIHSSSAPFFGSGVPPSVYMGAPPYGSALFNGSSIAPYDLYPGGSPYHFDSRLSSGGPFRPPLYMSGPSPFSGGSMMGNGAMYGVPPSVNRYGIPMAPAAAAGVPRPGVFPDDSLPKSDAKGYNDWLCPKCGNVNFSSRAVCNMRKCSTPRPVSQVPRPGFHPDDSFPKTDAIRYNDWNCPKCGNVNFSSRTVCNMRKCGTPKPGSQVDNSEQSAKQKVPEGSWTCEKCGNVNYPNRTKCNRQKCGADRPADSYESPSAENLENDQ